MGVVQPQYPVRYCLFSLLILLDRYLCLLGPGFLVHHFLHLAHTILAEVMHLLDSSAHWTIAQIRGILERLACHLPMSLLRMGRLFLWHSLENTLPYSF